MDNEVVLCSKCFKRHGLQLMASRFGKQDSSIPCPNCGSFGGYMLTRSQCQELAIKYISDGSYNRSTFGGAPIVAVNEYAHSDDLFLDNADVLLLEEKSGYHSFLYAPQTWRVGNTTWLDDLQSINRRTRRSAIRELIKASSVCEQFKGGVFYRLLTQLYGETKDPLTYDSPNWIYQKEGRFGIENTSILYLSSSIESAIHECRVTIEDEMYLASVVIDEPVRILDLTTATVSSDDPSEDISYSLFCLFGAGKDSYPITHEIAEEVFQQGYDGLMYWSYFNRISHQKSMNLALFGTPIKDGRVKVVSIDRLLLEQVHYSYSLGVLM